MPQDTARSDKSRHSIASLARFLTRSPRRVLGTPQFPSATPPALPRSSRRTATSGVINQHDEHVKRVSKRALQSVQDSTADHAREHTINTKISRCPVSILQHHVAGCRGRTCRLEAPTASNKRWTVLPTLKSMASKYFLKWRYSSYERATVYNLTIPWTAFVSPAYYTLHLV